jgi:hypothetical protein
MERGTAPFFYFPGAAALVNDDAFCDVLLVLYKCHMHARGAFFPHKLSVGPLRTSIILSSTIYQFPLCSRISHFSVDPVVDWLWHSHQLQIPSYHKDCQACFGFIITHHPHSKGTTNDEAFDQAKNKSDVWKQLYGFTVPEMASEFRRLAMREEAFCHEVAAAINDVCGYDVLDKSSYGIMADKSSYGIAADKSSYGITADKSSYGIVA